MTIVGIVKDVRTRGPNRPVQAEIFMPYEQHQGPATSLNIVMRTDAADPLAHRRDGDAADPQPQS